jgi:tetratricopeptide (TPR) repeat protein
MIGMFTHSLPTVYKHRLFLAGVFLIALTLAAYWQITGHDFIIIDDEVYVYENPHVQKGITSESLAWAFSFADKEATYWHPLSWISHMVDCSLFGLRPGWHHFSSLLLHLNPDNARGHFNLGVALSRKGDSAGALKHYRRALELKPDFAEGHNNIAILYFNRGNLSRAKEHLQRAIQLYPDNTVAKKNLDMIRMQPN